MSTLAIYTLLYGQVNVLPIYCRLMAELLEIAELGSVVSQRGHGKHKTYTP